MEINTAIVAGTGKSGISATKLLVNHGVKVYLFDENKDRDIEAIKEKTGDSELVQIELGELGEDALSSSQLMVISPGIPVDAPFTDVVRNAGIPIWSEIELAYHYGKGKIAAITGTNGKTTTTALVGDIVKAHNAKTIVVGNIGIPYTELCDTTDDDSDTVAEISSFQLETVIDFHPNVSAILNLTPDHLNRHYTFENYGNVKFSITKNQTMDDVTVLNYDDEHTRAMGEKAKDHCHVVYFSRLEKPAGGVYVEDGDIILEDGDKKINVLAIKDLKLMGAHNVENVLAAVGISYYMGVPVDVIRDVATSFKAVAHRIEYVDTVDGVAYYNDSKGTNPDAAIKGIQAMVAPTFLIGGGYDKGSEYDEWIEAFDGKVKWLVLIGQTAQKIADCAKRHGFNSIIFEENLQDAVAYCHENAVDGDAVLLSPACASWGQFDNYEQRGDMFKEYVRSYKE
ncbi:MULTISPECIES: UDP-N-acetylmuramoyl-L-alanine--D-glutamate ligase [unclassified Coprococcus]|uniref:UDP-N-acetylmuramoyl-L-alanine--D-glutamate ligase n=1 Tax=unclassified Coprococcus TaxID=2684943 RepID=UPI000E46C773|nr:MULTISPECIES: UDP-N-acetylmuramoyl-L-alanine--D-glutamate ligase [unclassified Coprococcus]RGI38840.1 UDP-N-acetylmuramoyl-L-alanine--D-glutamate ligase [Coprococcus sp. OM06-34AC]RGI42451.1 UDP-N-acetylmuramoyl-L-alanine--D-glutamate ligase [Coprococcus sp. OM06-25]